MADEHFIYMRFMMSVLASKWSMGIRLKNGVSKPNSTAKRTKRDYLMQRDAGHEKKRAIPR